MEAQVIGAKHARLRRLRKLSSRAKTRSQERVFVVDGPQLVAEALASPLRVVEIFAGPGELERTGLAAHIGPDVECFEVAAEVLVEVLDPVTPRPVAAVVAMPERSLDAVVEVSGPILMAVELRDPGNLGTIMRSAEAAAMAGLVIVGDSVDRFSPKVVRASAGSVFRLPTVGPLDPMATIDELAATGRPLAATVVDPAASAYDQVDLTEAVILVGNEPNGLAADVVERADLVITIPMAPGIESLNVASAASVLCFESARQRRALGPGGAQKSGGEPPIGQSSWPE